MPSFGYSATANLLVLEVQHFEVYRQLEKAAVGVSSILPKAHNR
jgi:hypothetical protein